MGKASVTEEVISYIEKHFDQELSLEEIAGALHYSRYYVARAFKESTGMTLHKYIQGRRLQEAARKLAQSGQPIIEVAFNAGYGSQQAFTQAFRREYQCTPQEYRRTGGKGRIVEHMGNRQRFQRACCPLEKGVAA